jgi:hypothetical protein
MKMDISMNMDRYTVWTMDMHFGPEHTTKTCSIDMDRDMHHEYAA